MASEPAPARHGRLNLRSLLITAVVIVMIGAAATLFGWDLSGWFKEVWNTITTISIGYLIAGIALITIQTTGAAFAWYSILRYAYPGQIRWTGPNLGQATDEVLVGEMAVDPAKLAELRARGVVK